MQFILTIIALAKRFVDTFEAKVSNRDLSTISQKLGELAEDEEFITEVGSLVEKYAGKTSEVQAGLMDGQLNLSVIVGIYKSHLDNIEEIVKEISENDVIMSRVRKLFEIKAFQNVVNAYLETSVTTSDQMNQAVKKLLAA